MVTWVRRPAATLHGRGPDLLDRWDRESVPVTKVTKAVHSVRKRRLNPRALIVLGMVILAALPGLIGLRSLQQQRGGAALLNQARQAIAAKQPHNALGFLNRYLELNPDSLAALDLKAKLLADTARDTAQLYEAVQVHTRVLGLVEKLAEANKVKRSDWIETRRRLVRLSVAMPTDGQAPAVLVQAQTLVEELQASGHDDAEAHRLLARALEMVADPFYSRSDKEKRELLVRAREEYDKAEALEPGDVKGAEGLAQLYVDRLHEPDLARKVIERAIASTNPDAPGRDPKTRADTTRKHAAALLLRARFAMHQAASRGIDAEALTPDQKADLMRKAQADLDAALRLDSNNLDIRLSAAERALLPPRVNTADARRYLAAVPPDRRDDREVKLLEARIDLLEQHPDAAIQAYRAGLRKTGGTDAELTWQLVTLLLDLGRVDSVTRELIDQYERLGQASLAPAARVGQAQHDEEVRKYEARCQYLRGRFQLKLNRPADAIRILEPLRNRSLGDLAQLYDVDLGNAYYATRDVEKAREAFIKATEQPQVSAAPWIALARLDRAERPDAAIGTLRRGLARFPYSPELLAELADILFRRELAKPDRTQRSWGEVEALLKKAEESNPTAPDVVLLRAKYLSAINRYEDAVAWIETASKNQPKSVELWNARVNVEVGRGQLGKALELLDQAEAAAGPQAAFTLGRAAVWIQRGELTRACDVLNQGLTRVPPEQQAILWKDLGALRQSRREFPAARAAFEAWAKLEPDNPDPRLALVDVAIAAGDDAALDRAVQTVREVAGEKGYQWRLVRIQLLLRGHAGARPSDAQLDEADRLVQEIRENDPKLPMAEILQGQVCEKRGQVDKAIAAYTRALELNGGNDALTLLVALLVREKRDKDLEALKRKDGISASAVDQIAAMQALRAGNRGQAERLAALAVQGNPNGFDVRTWQAEVLRALGKPKEAEAELRKLTAENPGDLNSWLQLLMLLASQGRKAEAAATVETMRTSIKTDAYPAQNFDLVWAQCYRVAGNINRAVEFYNDALSKHPNDPTVFQGAILFFDQTGRPDLKTRAIDLLQAVYDRDKTNGWIRRHLAELLASRAGDRASWERALAVIGPDTRPDDTADDKVCRARVYALSPAADNHQKALGILQALVVELPESAPVHEALARLLAADRRPADALPHAAKAAEGDRANPDAIFVYAGVLFALKDAGGAAAQLARLEQIDPRGLPVVELKAKVLALQGKPAEAVAVLEDTFNAHAGSPDAMDVGDAVVSLIRGLGQPEAAERVARKMAALGSRGRCVLARQRALRGHHDEAATLLEEAARTDPATAANTALTLSLEPRPEPRYLDLAERFLGQAAKTQATSDDPREKQVRLDLMEKQALVRHLQRRYPEEVALYRAILAEKPTNLMFLNNFAWTLSEELNNPQEGLHWADEVIKSMGPQPALLDTRGMILCRLGRYDESVRTLDEAARATPAASFLYHLARTYHKMNRPDDARSYRDRARQAGLTRDQLQPSELADWDAVMTR